MHFADTLILVNPHAGSAEEVAPILGRCLLQPGTRVVSTRDADDLGWLVHQAVSDPRRRPSRLVACGGDGTISTVVDHLARLARERGVAVLPSLGLLPAGTANDLARALDCGPDLSDAADVLDQASPRGLDVLRLSHHPRDGGEERTTERFAVNALIGGPMARLGEVMERDSKARWGGLSYLGAGLRRLDSLEPFEAELTLDGVTRTERLIGIGIGNGVSAGGGWKLDRTALLDDGCMEIVLLKPAPVGALFADLARHVAGSEDFGPERVEILSGQRVSVRCDPPQPWSIDGEPLPPGDLEVEVVPELLQVLAGPEACLIA